MYVVEGGVVGSRGEGDQELRMSRKRVKNRLSSRAKCATRSTAARKATISIYSLIKRYVSNTQVLEYKLCSVTNHLMEVMLIILSTHNNQQSYVNE